MKALDVLAGVLVIVGALNWGLVGVFKLDLVAALFGGTLLSAAVYTLVGLAGIYQAIGWKAMSRRWCQPAVTARA